LHDQKADIVVLTDVVHGADVRMIQRRDRARLALEAAPQVGVFRERLWQNLDSDDAVEARISGAIDLAHTASAEGAADLVRTEASTSRERHARRSADYKRTLAHLRLDRDRRLVWGGSVRHCCQTGCRVRRGTTHAHGHDDLHGFSGLCGEGFLERAE